MPLNRPTLGQIAERILGDMASRLPGTDPKLRHSPLEIIGKVQAGGIHGLYGHLDFFAKQLFPDTADVEFLEQWASIWGVARKAAVAATGPVTFTGTNGSVIPAGTTIQRADGVQYTTNVPGTIATGFAEVPVTAQVTGVAGNAINGSTVSLASPIAGVNSAANVAMATIAGGLEAEDDTGLRTRLLARIQRPPNGGTADDYENWALEVPGVTRAWALPLHTGAGTVAVVFAVDDDPVGPIPNAAKVAEVQTYIDTLRPVTATFTALAPTALAINFSITLVADNPANLAAVKTAVQAELADLIAREGTPAGTLYISRINEAISRAVGEFNHTLTAPIANVAISNTQLATLGIITWA